ncbi:MAG: nucleotidyltransferase family protein [Lachnospiraceae bacterium]|nr:nucleotidyltransferase family protein [Lachnospiraceae bacterium]
MQKEKLTSEEQALLRILAEALLASAEKSAGSPWNIDQWQLPQLSAAARKHAVLPLLYDVVCGESGETRDKGLTENSESTAAWESFQQEVETAARHTVPQAYHLLFLTKYLVAFLEAHGASVIVLKGVSAAADYPVPELRKSGDVDLLLAGYSDGGRLDGISEKFGREHPEHPEGMPKGESMPKSDDTPKSEGMPRSEGMSKRDGMPKSEGMPTSEGTPKREDLQHIMAEAGFHLTEIQDSVHHDAYVSPEGIEVELHLLPAEPFEDSSRNERMKTRMRQCQAHCIRRDIMGIEFPVLDRPYQAWHLLLHMLQHFLRAGFGLKLLCDWSVLFAQPWSEGEKQELTGILREDGLCRFASLVTGACVNYLGLDASDVSFLNPDEAHAEQFLREVFDSEEFGHSDSERMVAMKGSRLTDYIREFHHQMHLNYPQKGRIVPLWPALWTLTLLRFLRNNRRVRHTSTLSILKAAGKRSRRMEELRIFDE